MNYLFLFLIALAVIFPSSLGFETVRGGEGEFEEQVGLRQLSSKGKGKGKGKGKIPSSCKTCDCPLERVELLKFKLDFSEFNYVGDGTFDNPTLGGRQIFNGAAKLLGTEDPIGKATGICTYTKVSATPEENETYCTLTGALDAFEGTFTFVGPKRYNEPWTWAVVAGTGDFIDWKGESTMTIEFGSKWFEGTIYELQYNCDH